MTICNYVIIGSIFIKLIWSMHLVILMHSKGLDAEFESKDFDTGGC